MRPLARIRSAAVGWLVGLLEAVGVAGAQSLARPGISHRAPGAVLVYPLPAGGGESSRFVVPQVRLASAKLARLVNRRLLRYALQNADIVDTLASPAQQLRQAARSCCYDPDTRQWQVGRGLTHGYYRVLFNQGGLLSLELTEEFTGTYSWERSKHLTLDLRTGRQLALCDVVADAPAQLRRLRGAVSRRLGEALDETTEYYGDEPATIAHVAEQFQWNWATHQTAIGEGADLTDFALTPQKLLLFFQVGFAHVEANFEPDATYRFAYTSLRPQPPLRRALGLLPAAKK